MSKRLWPVRGKSVFLAFSRSFSESKFLTPFPESALHVGETANFEIPTDNPVLSAELTLTATEGDVGLAFNVQEKGAEVPIGDPQEVTGSLRALADLGASQC